MRNLWLNPVMDKRNWSIDDDFVLDSPDSSVLSRRSTQKGIVASFGEDASSCKTSTRSHLLEFGFCVYPNMEGVYRNPGQKNAKEAHVSVLLRSVNEQCAALQPMSMQCAALHSVSTQRAALQHCKLCTHTAQAALCECAACCAATCEHAACCAAACEPAAQ